MGRRVTAVLLAGGASSRYGADKAFALWEGKPFLQCVAEAARVVSDAIYVLVPPGVDPRPYARLVPGATIVADRLGQAGPVAALRDILPILRTPTVLVVPCDAPGLPHGLARRLVALSEESKTIAMAVIPTGPLFDLFSAPRELLVKRLASAHSLKDVMEGAEQVPTDAIGLNENEPRPT